MKGRLCTSIALGPISKDEAKEEGSGNEQQQKDAAYAEVKVFAWRKVAGARSRKFASLKLGR
jgi:hypothetical protein